jgi:hypothetical protein
MWEVCTACLFLEHENVHKSFGKGNLILKICIKVCPPKKASFNPDFSRKARMWLNLKTTEHVILTRIFSKHDNFCSQTDKCWTIIIWESSKIYKRLIDTITSYKFINTIWYDLFQAKKIHRENINYQIILRQLQEIYEIKKLNEM